MASVPISPFDWLHPVTPTPIIGLVSTLGGWLERMPVLHECAGSLYIRCQRPLA